MDYLPWHQNNWDRITMQFIVRRNPHALLLYGASGLGKRVFAESLSSLLLCQAPMKNKHCGRCRGCVLKQAGTHPDLRHVRPESSRQIKIDQIRELNRWSVQTSQQGGYKIAIIYPSEQMNVQSANAFLKVLEEPPPQTLFILVADKVLSILPTVRSRCQSLLFSVPKHTEALQWLKSQHDHTDNLAQLLIQSGGAPLEVSKLLNGDYIRLRNDVAQNMLALLSRKTNALEKAANLQKYQPIDVLKVLESFVSKAIRLSMVKEEKNISSQDEDHAPSRLLASLEVTALFQFRDQLLRAVRSLSGNSNPNPLLLIEAIFVNLSRAQIRN